MVWFKSGVLVGQDSVAHNSSGKELVQPLMIIGPSLFSAWAAPFKDLAYRSGI